MDKSKAFFERAKTHIPGGVNSPVRAFNGVGGSPIFFQAASGAYLIDVDDKHYIDYVGSWGPMILGHNHPKVIAAIHTAVDKGLSFGAPSPFEVDLAELISEIMPHLEMIRMVNSGTEATMTAIRLARAITGRDKIIKFDGCYHGHSDSLLVNAGSGALTLGVPSSPGVPADFAKHTLTANFNDLSSVEALFSQYPNSIAAIIVEPIAGNMNCVPGQQAFIEGLRELCDATQSLLIFDEVMTGFRIGLGGATPHFNVTPDLTTLGKIIGGGLPVGAIGGSKTLMSYLAPVGPVYQAGTLSGNPIAMAAGYATLSCLREEGLYERLGDLTDLLMQSLRECAASHHLPFTTNHVGGMFGFFFNDVEKIESFAEVKMSDVSRFKNFYHGMLSQGLYFAPSAFEAGFISMAHTHDEIKMTIEAADKVFAKLISSDQSS